MNREAIFSAKLKYSLYYDRGSDENGLKLLMYDLIVRYSFRNPNRVLGSE